MDNHHAFIWWCPLAKVFLYAAVYTFLAPYAAKKWVAQF
jgi:hypothetical protein